MRSSLTIAGAFTLGIAALASMSGACSADEQASGSSAGTGANGSGSGATGSGSAQGGGGPTMSGGSGGETFVGSSGASMDDGGADAACAASSAEATLTKKPVDIIIIIDNSGSMSDEIESVEKNINDNFAAIIGASGIDYRVIMVADHGSFGSQKICVKAPLSGTTCSPIPAMPAINPPIFYQYSVLIGSHNSVCQAINAYKGGLKDDYNLAPTGWSEWVRPEAFKVFVEITDDGVGSCSAGGNSFDDNDNAADGMTAAAKIDAALLALDPAQFGDATKRNYVWHSIIGLKENVPPTAAYGPADPMVTAKCASAEANGSGYQALSILTGGLRFPLCNIDSYDVVFQEIAKGVVEGSQVKCEFPIPDAPPGETIDPSTVIVEYIPGNMGPTTKFKQVASAAACAADSFYIEDKLIKLCSEPCAIVQADAGAKVNVLFGCEVKMN